MYCNFKKVSRAIDKLNSGKGDGIGSVKTDHFKNGNRELSVHICTMYLKETISYYVNNGSSVFCTLLDATKAFHRVEYVKLFKLLMVRDIPPVSLRLL